MPAGILSDRIKKGRLLLGNSSLILGASYALLPFFVGSMIGISALLFTSGAASTFFVPLLDGVGTGIYGVVIALMCSDLTKGKSGFNTLLGIMQRKHLDRFGS